MTDKRKPRFLISAEDTKRVLELCGGYKKFSEIAEMHPQTIFKFKKMGVTNISFSHFLETMKDVIKEKRQEIAELQEYLKLFKNK